MIRKGMFGNVAYDDEIKQYLKVDYEKVDIDYHLRTVTSESIGLHPK